MSRRVGFDTSVWSAHFEQQTVHDLSMIAGLFDSVDRAELSLYVPTVVLAELYNVQNQVSRVDAALRSPSITVVDLTEPAAILAGSVRRRCKESYGFKAGMPDTLIVATCQVFGCEEVFTVDEGMIRLGEAGLFSIKVSRPHGQASLWQETDDPDED